MKKAVLLAGLTTLMTTAAFAAEMKVLAFALFQAQVRDLKVDF